MNKVTIFRQALLSLTVLAVGGMYVISCAAPAADIPTLAPTPSNNAVASSTSGPRQKLNIDELLPPAPGRELVLDYCITCHSISPIVLARKTRDEWIGLRHVHTGRVTLSQEELDKLYNYLIANLTPDRPIPPLPKDLIDYWTSD
jgi:hypothetical protein